MRSKNDGLMWHHNKQDDVKTQIVWAVTHSTKKPWNQFFAAICKWKRQSQSSKTLDTWVVQKTVFRKQAMWSWLHFCGLLPKHEVTFPWKSCHSYQLGLCRPLDDLSSGHGGVSRRNLRGCHITHMRQKGHCQQPSRHFACQHLRRQIVSLGS